MGQHESATRTVVNWALGTPVLAWRLALIAGEDIDELAHTVTDVLDPQRSPLWEGYLTATGADVRQADAVWEEVGGITGMYNVGWHWVALALMAARPAGD